MNTLAIMNYNTGEIDIYTVSDDVFKIIKEEKKTAIMVTHDINEAISMGDQSHDYR